MATTGTMAGSSLTVLFFLMLAGVSAEVLVGSATWSGAPDGAGNQAGTCGFGDAVATAPFSSMVTGFASGDGDCGACYKVTCTGHEACSAQGVSVTVSDSCRSSMCAQTKNHFDMAGHAFGAMAKPGRADDLRAAGTIGVLFENVDCHYRPPPNTPTAVYPAFKVDPRATTDNFAVTLLYVGWSAAPTSVTVYLKNAGGKYTNFQKMVHSHGATWNFTNYMGRPIPVRPPLSILVYMPVIYDPRVPAKSVQANDVIPVGWQPGTTYLYLYKGTLA